MAELFLCTAEIVVQMIVLCSLEPALPEILRTGQRPEKQLLRRLRMAVPQRLPPQLQKRRLILHGDFALSPFPRMEAVCRYEVICLLIPAGAVQKRRIFHTEIIAGEEYLPVFLKQAYSSVKIPSGLSVQLVKLIEHAGVRPVKRPCPLQRRAGPFPVMALIEIYQGKVAEYRRKSVVYLRRRLPQLLRKFPLLSVIVETAQIIARFRRLTASVYGKTENRNILKVIRETAGRIAGLRLPDRLARFHLPAGSAEIIGTVIRDQRMFCTGFLRKA